MIIYYRIFFKCCKSVETYTLPYNKILINIPNTYITNILDTETLHVTNLPEDKDNEILVYKINPKSYFNIIHDKIIININNLLKQI